MSWLLQKDKGKEGEEKVVEVEETVEGVDGTMTITPPPLEKKKEQNKQEAPKELCWEKKKDN